MLEYFKFRVKTAMIAHQYDVAIRLIWELQDMDVIDEQVIHELAKDVYYHQLEYFKEIGYDPSGNN